MGRYGYTLKIWNFMQISKLQTCLCNKTDPKPVLDEKSVVWKEVPKMFAFLAI
jgi:hypothetical protein